jgi:hypothetical protein
MLTMFGPVGAASPLRCEIAIRREVSPVDLMFVMFDSAMEPDCPVAGRLATGTLNALDPDASV